MELSMRIKEFREKAGLTQEELAERMEVQRNTVWRWENQKANIKAATLQKLSEVLKVPYSDFVEDDKTSDEHTNFSLSINPAQTKENLSKETRAGMATLSLGGGKELIVPATSEGYAFLRDIALRTLITA